MFRRLALLIALISVSGCGREEKVDLAPPAASPATTSAALRTSYAEVVKRVSTAVVTVRTESRTRAPRQFPFIDDPFFRRFFAEPLTPAPDQRVRGSASGVIVTADGYILTNHHLIDGAKQVEVDLQGSRTVTAKLVGSDPPSDLAVLKIDADGLSTLALADSDEVQVGDIVLAVGNSLRIGETVTLGIISAKGPRTGLSDGSFEDFLQTDAPINQGNSGGALVNGNGKLVGINSQILSPSGASIGIGFVIPSNMARDVLEQIIKHGKVIRGHLGVAIQPVTEDIATSLKLSTARGVIVSHVQADSAAERAGLKTGDLILALNGDVVSDSNSFRNDIAGTPPGRTVTLRIWRAGNEQELRPTLGEFVFEERAERATEESSPEAAGSDRRLGLVVQPLTPAVASELGISSNTQGLVIVEVNTSGPALDAGIQRGDVIEQVNQQPVRSVADLKSAIDRAGKNPLLILVNHRGTTTFVTLKPR